MDESYKVEREATCSASLEVFCRQSKVKDVWVLCLVSSVKAVKLGLDTDSVQREGRYFEKTGEIDPMAQNIYIGKEVNESKEKYSTKCK